MWQRIPVYVTTMIMLIMLSACGSNDDQSKETVQDNTAENNNVIENNEENNDANNDSEEGNDSHMPNVPDGPNVPDPPEGASPNVPDGPNIPDFPDVDLPNVDIDGDEDEITMQVPDDLLFDFDEYELKSEAKGTLDEIAKALEAYDGADVQINGHTDNQGDKEYNMELSEKRAASVEKYLDSKGALEQVNVTIKGYGETKPIVSNDSEDGQQKNRRVEVVIDTPDE